MKWRTDSAMEFTWPGVPVTAWASILPWRSKTPAERSPDFAHDRAEGRAQQSLGLLLDHGEQPVPHDLAPDGGKAAGCVGHAVTILQRRAAIQDDAALRIDDGVEGGGDEGGGLVLGDEGGALDAGTGREIGAPIDRHLHRAAGVGIEHPPPPGLGRREASGRGAVHGTRALGRRAHGQRPGQDLDLPMGNDAREERAIFPLEGLAQQGGVRFRQIARRQRHHDLMALADIAHEGRARLDKGRIAGAGAHHLQRLLPHLGDDRIGQGGLEGGEAHIAAAHHLEGDGRAQETHGRADPGIGRHDDPGDGELLRQPRGMKRRRAAEGDQAVLGDDLAPLHRMDARRIGHVLVDDLRHAITRQHRR